MERIGQAAIGRTGHHSATTARVGGGRRVSVVVVVASVALLVGSALIVMGRHSPTGTGTTPVRGLAITETPDTTDGAGAPPACAYRDAITAHATYDDWADTILDTALRLPQDYVPPDLVAIADPGGSGGQVRSFVRAPLLRLLEAARRAGETITVSSAYRSYARQVQVFDSLVAAYGTDFALLSAARPGHSEHQLGTAVDFDGGEDWLADNAWRFGFARSYPPDRSPEKTCYKFEPWHFRYVGQDRAKAIHTSGLSPREWLWETVGG